MESTFHSFHMQYMNWGTGRKTNEDTSTTEKHKNTEISATTRDIRKQLWSKLHMLKFYCIQILILKWRWEDGIGNKLHFTRRWSWTTSSRNLWTPPQNATVVTITLTQSTGNVLAHLPRQVVSRTGSEERVGCPNHKGVLVAAGTKQRRQQLQHPT